MLGKKPPTKVVCADFLRAAKAGALQCLHEKEIEISSMAGFSLQNEHSFLEALTLLHFPCETVRARVCVCVCLCLCGCCLCVCVTAMMLHGSLMSLKVATASSTAHPGLASGIGTVNPCTAGRVQATYHSVLLRPTYHLDGDG